MVTTRRRFITPEDLAFFRFAGDPQISPDGTRVLERHDLSRTGNPDRRLARLEFILR